MKTEMIAMNIIANAGDGKALAFEALTLAQEGDLEKAHECINESKKAFVKTHKAQTELLTAEANGENVEIDVLLVHAQDHLMTSMLAQELIENMIQMQEKINQLEEKMKVEEYK